MMDLILWRHAQAEVATAGMNDLDRALTPRGEKEAARMGAWLDRHLPGSVRILCSPARRCEQTVQALGRKYRIEPQLAPDALAQALLAAARWPDSRQVVVLVGHQPTLGRVIAQLLGLNAGECAVRKGAVWWLRAEQREGVLRTVVVTVKPPELA